MTTAHVLNDTSTHDHAGCRAVMQSLYARLAGAEIVGKTHVNDWNTPRDFNGADLVVCNGEGSMHHGRPWAQHLLGLLQRAQEQDRRTMLVNSVWQEMVGWGVVLSKCEKVWFRELRSAKESMRNTADEAGVLTLIWWGWGGASGPSRCHPFPDLCLDAATPPTKPGPHAGHVVLGDVGASCLTTLWGELEDRYPRRESMAGQTFQQLVDNLAGCECYVTAQHHGVYAAAIAGVPFTAYPSNSWKIEALMDWHSPLTEKPAQYAYLAQPFSAWLLALPRMPMLVEANP